MGVSGANGGGEAGVTVSSSQRPRWNPLTTRAELRRQRRPLSCRQALPHKTHISSRVVKGTSIDKKIMRLFKNRLQTAVPQPACL